MKRIALTLTLILALSLSASSRPLDTYRNMSMSRDMERSVTLVFDDADGQAATLVRISHEDARKLRDDLNAFYAKER